MFLRPLKERTRSFQTSEMIAFSFVITSGTRHICTLLAIVSTVFAGISSSTAQAPAREDFFGKDFASSPMADVKVNEDSPNPKPPRQPLREREDRRRTLPGLPSNRIGDEQRQLLTQTSSATRQNIDPKQKSGDAVIKLSLVVNSLDRNHFETSIRELISVAQKRKIPVGGVMHVGDYRSVTPSIQASIQEAGGSISGETAPPPQYGIESSPAWILDTPNGEIILEGVRSIGLYIDGGGNFVEKPIVPDRAPEVEVRGEF